MGYKDIETEYVRNKVKNLFWEESEYIDSLMFLEQVASGEISGMAGCMKANSLIGNYETEYWEILKEIDPQKFRKRYKEKLEKEKREALEHEKYLKEEQDAEEKAKKEWLELGGKI